jgi:thiamine pyrophosphokinase
MAQSDGLRWPLDTVTWKRGVFGISNVPITDKFTITVISGRFLVVVEGV